MLWFCIPQSQRVSRQKFLHILEPMLPAGHARAEAIVVFVEAKARPGIPSAVLHARPSSSWVGRMAGRRVRWVSSAIPDGWGSCSGNEAVLGGSCRTCTRHTGGRRPAWWYWMWWCWWCGLWWWWSGRWNHSVEVGPYERKWQRRHPRRSSGCRRCSPHGRAFARTTW